MPVNIKDIKGCLIDRKFSDNADTPMSLYKVVGYNQAIELQGNREIGINREKLKSILDKFQASDLATHTGTYAICDAIISEEHELLEVKNDS